MYPLILWTLTALAVYRATMLVTHDTISEPARNRLTAWARDRHDTRHQPDARADLATTPGTSGEATWVPCCTCGWEGEPTHDRTTARHVARSHANQPPPLETFITCPWCVSVWLAAPFAALSAYHGTQQAWHAVIGTLTASAITGIIAGYHTP